MTTPSNSRVLFFLLKNPVRYSEFFKLFCPNKTFTYEICFRDYPLDYSDYTIGDYESWYKYLRTIVDLENLLKYFWFSCSKYEKLLKSEWATWDAEELLKLEQST